MTPNPETPVSTIHEFRSVHGECPDIPDDLSIPQFFLDSWHSLRPKRPVGSPWVIDDESGNSLDYEQVSLVESQHTLAPPVDHSPPVDPIAELRPGASS